MADTSSKPSFRLLAQKALRSQRENNDQPEEDPPDRPQSQNSLSRREIQPAKKPLRLDINKVKPTPVVELPAPTSKNFREVVKAVMLIRNWINPRQATTERQNIVSANQTLESPSVAADDIAILNEEAEEMPRSNFWRNFKEKLVKGLQQIRHLAVRPTGGFYYYWSLLVFLAVLYNMLAMVIFVFDDVYHNYFWQWLVINFVADLIYVLDIIFSVRKVYLFDGLEVETPRLMWRNYRIDPAPLIGSFMVFDREVGGRIIIDIFCLFPLDFILILVNYVSLVRTVRVLKCATTFLFEILHSVHRFLDFVELTKQRSMFPHATKIFFLMLWCFILFHWNACVYFMFSLAEGLSEEDTNAFGFSYYKVFDPRFPQCSAFDDDCLKWENYSVLDLDDERPNYMEDLYTFWENKSMIVTMGNFSREYSMSMYWSSLTITTCGQQPYPSSSSQNMLEVADTLIGVLVFATIIGSVGGVVYLMNQDLNNYRLQMDAIKFYMIYRNVRKEIQDRVLKCFMFLHSRHQLADEKEILDVLPPRMQGSIASDLHMSIVGPVQLFQGCSKGFLVDIVLCLRQQVFMPHDVLCKAGDKAKEMFIIKSGRLHVTDEDGIVVDEISDGCTFGEMSIIQMKGNTFGDKRTSGLISIGYSDVYILNQDDVLPLLAEYPDERERLLANAKRWLEDNDMLEETEDEDGLFKMQATAAYSHEEQFVAIQKMLDEMEERIEERTREYKEITNGMKQRLANLEEIFRVKRDEIRRDCILGAL